MSRWLPFLQWPRPTLALLRAEGLAALTIALVMVPQSVAYANLAGMPLIAGLYASLLPALAAALFSASTRLSVGPTALTSVLVGAALLGMAQPGSVDWIALTVWLALLSGGIQLALGLSGGAWVLNVVSSPVLAGFSQAAALLIIASQLPHLLGLKGDLSTLLATPDWDTWALASGVISLFLFVLGKRFMPRVPMMLLVLAASAAFAWWSGYSEHGAVIGELPAGFPALYIPALPSWDTLQLLVMPALVIALVSSLEMASSAKIESQHDGKRWDANQDLVGQGVGKFVSALSGSFPTSTSFSRSAITLYAGAKTGWATVIATAFVLVVLLFLTPVLRHVPRAVLAAVVVAAVSGLIRPGTLPRLWRIDRIEALTALVTFAVTLALSPRIYWGVLAGVLMGLAHFLYLRLHPRIIEVGLHSDGSMRDRHLWKLPPVGENVFAMRMDGALDFASASAFERTLVEHISAHPDTKNVMLFAHPINRIDATGVEVFIQLRKMLAERGIELHVSGIKLPVQQVLERAGALTPGPLLHIHRTDADAMRAAAARSSQQETIQPSSGSIASGSP